MTLRTLWLTNDLPPRAGGIQQFVHNLLVGSWPEAALVVGPADDHALHHDANQPYAIERLPGGVWPTPAVRTYAVEAAQRHRADVVILGATWPLGELAGAITRECDLPVVGVTHGLEAGLASLGAGYLLRRATRHLAAATTITTYTATTMGRHLQAPLQRQVSPGVDVELFHPEVDRAGLRAQWGIPDEALLVGCISRLVARKGQDALLDAWPDIHRDHPDAWLVLVGEGPLEAKLQAAAVQLPNVVVAGPVSWANLPAAYASLDVFAMPCRTRLAGTDVEGLGIVYLEAQACAVPAIAGESGGAPEAVRHGETGLVVDGTRRDEIVSAISTLLGDATLREEMGARGRAWMVEKWSWPAITEDFRGVLEDAVRA